MKLLITGDFFVNNPSEIQIDDSLVNLFSSCDYRIVNFEAPIKSLDYTELPTKSGPRLMQPVETRVLLKKLNINALTLANNHIMDYGVQGYNKTVSLLEDFCLMGAGTWNEVYAIQKISVGGIKLGFINLSEMQFGMLSDRWCQNEESIGCAWINHVCVNNIILEGRKEVDCLIAIVHAGVEMIDIPLPEWRDRYREMIDLGCDAVVAHHPHVVQGYETYKNKPIFYSLGNFCFSKLDNFASPNWNIGACVVLDITSSSFSSSFLGITFDGQKISLIDDAIWNKKVLYLNSLLDDTYMENVNNVCLKTLPDYWQLMNMSGLIHKDKYYIKSILRWILRKYSEVHLMNVLQCESHRWAFLRALSITNNQ